jgi:hypothetical protein
LFRKGLPPPPPPASNNDDDEKVVLCKKGVDVKYHPVFDPAFLTADQLDGVVIFVNTPRGKETKVEGEGTGGIDGGEDDEDKGYYVVKVEDLSCFNEYATSPPSREIIWQMGGKPHVENPLGVTVKDAVVAAVKMWSSAPDVGVRESFVEMFDPKLFEGDSDEEDFEKLMREEFAEAVGLAPGQKLTWRHTLGDHCFWEGMESARVLRSDVVALEPRWFGS